MQTMAFNEKHFFLTTFRIGTSACLAIVVTAVLILLMCYLIAMEPPEIVKSTTRIATVIMGEDRVIDEQPEPMEEKPADPEPEPDVPSFVESVNNPNVIEVTMAPVLDPVSVKTSGVQSSGSAVAIFRVAPQYPRRPQLKGIEGFVDLMFDIGPTGKTQNIRVVYAQPEGLFEKASIRALKKWKYRPAMEEGVARIQRDQTTRISFNLEN